MLSLNGIGKEEWERIRWHVLRDELNVAYIIECDLEYPTELHDGRNDYPLANERLDIQLEMQADTQILMSRH